MVTFTYDTINIPQPTTLITTLASITATAVVFTFAKDVIPEQIQAYFSTQCSHIAETLSRKLTVVVEEFNGLAPNQIFEAAEVYLGSKVGSNTRRISACKSVKESEIRVAEEVLDVYEGVRVWWVLVDGVSSERVVSGSCSCRRKKNCGGFGMSEMRCFEIRFHKKRRDFVIFRYLRHVLAEAKKIKESMIEIKHHTVDYYNGTDYWSCINLDHRATFDTIAMDPHVKNELIEDLDNFISRKDYYRRVGKAWKRGYFLYGPPGTEKSSLIAAMANYLKFNVYDLDLREVMCNSDLRRLLIGTASKSILVIENIDCSIESQNRESTEDGAISVDDEEVTLPDLLNFIDGLWSTCGDERIIVFTTNHKNCLDPSLSALVEWMCTSRCLTVLLTASNCFLQLIWI